VGQVVFSIIKSTDFDSMTHWALFNTFVWDCATVAVFCLSNAMIGGIDHSQHINSFNSASEEMTRIFPAVNATVGATYAPS
jgi:hypothetical protein